MMPSFELAVLLAVFAFIALSSRQLGRSAARSGLPLISGYLLAGMFAGPYVLGLLPEGIGQQLRIVDEISLGFIAFAAGSELFLREIRGQGRSIGLVNLGQILATFGLGAGTLYLLAENIPFIGELGQQGRLAVSLLAGSILVATSPASTIAVMNELRAKGPFTTKALSVTVIKDVAVIILFAISAAAAGALVMSGSLNPSFAITLVVDLALAGVISLGLWKWLEFILNRRISGILKIILILASGYAIFELSSQVREISHQAFPFEIHIEPLLVCMLAGFFVSNFGPHRGQLTGLLHRASTPVYVAFFTLAGAALELDLLAQAWTFALALFAIRLAGTFIGSYVGGSLAGDPPLHNRLSWMAFVTQAGVSLGLAKEVAVEFSPWGDHLATMIIAVIVLNQMLGPPLFKWAIRRVGEDHDRAERHQFDGVNDAVIFGLEAQSVALAHQLKSHGWQVRIAALEDSPLDEVTGVDADIRIIPEISEATLTELGVPQAEAVITLLGKSGNLDVCRLVYEVFGTPTLVARVSDRSEIDQLRPFEAIIVDPSVAIVSLLDHFVRSPAGASLLLGMHEDQDVIDIELVDPRWGGRRIRDLRLPGDTIILSVMRDGQAILSHGHTRLQLGDWVTVVGSQESLDQLSLQFGPD